MAARNKGSGRADFLFKFMMGREIQISVCVGWLSININDSKAVSSGNQGIQENDLTIIFKFNYKGNFGIRGV